MSETKTEVLDLTGITRGSDTIRTTIEMGDGYSRGGEMVIQLGECNLFERGGHRGEWELRSYLNRGATDPEEDSAHALSLGLVGVALESLHYGGATIICHVSGDRGAFRVPPPDYDPFGLEGTVICTQCEEPHPVVPEDYYLPPKTKEQGKLFERFKAQPVKIRTWRPR